MPLATWWTQPELIAKCGPDTWPKCVPSSAEQMPLPQAGRCPPFSRAHTREAQRTARSEPQAGGSQAASAGGSAPNPEVSVAPSGQKGPGPLTPAGWGERSSATAQTAFQKCHPSCLVCETEGSSTADAARGALWDGKGCVCV